MQKSLEPGQLIKQLDSTGPVTKCQLKLRFVEDADLPFLKILYGTTRAAELEQVPWDDQQKSQFISMQFNAQHTYYHEQFKQAAFAVVLKNKQAVGRIYLDIREREIRIIDIALMPAYQKMGIGKALLLGVQAMAESSELPITIHVEKNNPAMGLYQHLGYQMIEDQGVYDLMRWGSAESK